MSRASRLPTRPRVAVAGVVVLLGAGAGAALVSHTRDRAPVDRAPAVQAARPLSQDEADRLAVVRFRDYQARTVPVDVTYPAQSGAVHLSGDVDFRRELGYVRLSTDGRSDAGSTGLVQFTPSAVAFEAGSFAQLPPDPQPAGWEVLPMVTTGANPLHTVMRLVLGLGADRPENSSLLRQQGALWLRSDTVDGVAVDVFSGPSGSAAQTALPTAGPPASAVADGGSRTRLWVDATGRLRRFEARIGSSTQWTVIDLGTGTRPPVPALTGMPGIAAVAAPAAAPTPSR